MVIKDEELSGEVLARTIISIISDPELRGRMSKNSRDLGRPDAARVIAARLMEFAATRGRLAKLAAAVGEICSVR